MAKYGESNGYYYREDDDGKLAQISASDYAAGITAQDTGPIEAALVNTGKRMTNLFNKVPGIDMPQAPDNVMNALSQEHPVASTVGDVLPYMASAPVLGTIGIPGAMALGAAEGYGFSNPGSEGFDTAFGAAGAPLGNMAGRILQRVGKTVGIGKPSFREPLLTTAQKRLGKQGYWDKALGDTIGGGGSARLFGRENQTRMNKLVSEAIGYDPKAARTFSLADIDGALGQTYNQAEKLSKQIAEARTSPIYTKEYKARLADQERDIIDKAKVLMMAKMSVDAGGNIEPGKWLQAAEGMIEVADGVNLPKYTGGAADQAIERAKVLTDPELGAFTHSAQRSEETTADMFRTGLTPTGWGGLLNFLPAVTPTGAGSAVGTGAGLLAPTSLLDQKRNRDELPDDIR